MEILGKLKSFAIGFRTAKKAERIIAKAVDAANAETEASAPGPRADATRSSATGCGCRDAGSRQADASAFEGNAISQSKHRRYMARHKVGFFTQWLSACALNEAKRSLGSSNKSVDVA